MNGVLDRIVADKAAEVARLAERRAELRRAAEQAGPARGFARALARRGEVSVIAEYKRRSPSAGDLGAGDVSVTGRQYERGGAAAISVLTDGAYFGGDLSDLAAVRAAVAIPVLRKDFIVDEVQVWESRAAGADAVLLIARILSDSQLSAWIDLARELSFAALVEVHTASELERALRAGAGIIGINNRDLDRFVTDLEITSALASQVPSDRLLVSESGISRGEDVVRLGEHGADAVLIGETLMRSGAESVTRFVGHAKRARTAEPVWRASSC
jgi:indole-3-glycerol phosphate synthase